MTKREHPDTSDSDSVQSDNSSQISEFSENEQEINVDFDFLKLSEIDFYGLKSLVKDLLQIENNSNLVDYLISLDWGTVVKIDDQKDPYSIVTLVDLQDEKASDILEILKSKVGDDLDFTKRIGLILSNRLINMPPQIAPPCWEMLTEEIDLKIKAKALKPFDKFIYISKIYYSCARDSNSTPKIRKKDVQYFQAEDEFIETVSPKFYDYELDNQQVSDSRRVFTEEGIEHSRRIYVLPELSSVVDVMKKNVF